MTKTTMAVRRELVRVLRERYRVGTREERRRILEELVRLGGYHRKYAIAVLSRVNLNIAGERPTGAQQGSPVDRATRRAELFDPLD